MQNPMLDTTIELEDEDFMEPTDADLNFIEVLGDERIAELDRNCETDEELAEEVMRDIANLLATGRLRKAA